MARKQNQPHSVKIGQYELDYITLSLHHPAEPSLHLDRASATVLVFTNILANRHSQSDTAPAVPPQTPGSTRNPRSALSSHKAIYGLFTTLKKLVTAQGLDMHVKARRTSRSPATPSTPDTQLGRQTFRNVAGCLSKKLGLEGACTCGELLAAMKKNNNIFTFGAAGQGEAEGLRSLRLSEMVQIVENGCIDLTDSSSRDNAIELHLRNMPGVELPAAPATPASLEHYGTNSLAHCENGSLLLNTLTPAATAAPAAPASTRDNYMGVHQMAGSTFAQTVGMAAFNMPAGHETLNFFTFGAHIPGQHIHALPAGF